MCEPPVTNPLFKKIENYIVVRINKFIKVRVFVKNE